LNFKEVTLSQDFSELYIIPISDLHLGDPHCDLDKFFKYRKWIEERPNAFVILNGDIMNAAIKDSVSDLYNEEMNPNEQLKLAVKLFTPIKDRILMIVEGNHERRIAKNTSICVSEILASQLGCSFAPEGALIKVRFGKRRNEKEQVYTIYCTHGFGGGKKPGGKVNNLQSLGNIVLADIYIASHTHFMTGFQDIYFVPDLRNNKITEVKRTYVSSGAFLKYGGYGEYHGFSPAKTGSPRLRLDGTKKDVHLSI